jgi:DNA polymerase II large subunit
LPSYYGQRIALMKEEINAMFASSKKPKQKSLTDFA